MTWKECLINEIQDIIEHGWGQVNTTVHSQNNKVTIIVDAGKRYKFIVSKEILDD